MAEVAPFLLMMGDEQGRDGGEKDDDDKGDDSGRSYYNNDGEDGKGIDEDEDEAEEAEEAEEEAWDKGRKRLRRNSDRGSGDEVSATLARLGITPLRHRVRNEMRSIIHTKVNRRRFSLGAHGSKEQRMKWRRLGPFVLRLRRLFGVTSQAFLAEALPEVRYQLERMRGHEAAARVTAGGKGPSASDAKVKFATHLEHHLSRDDAAALLDEAVEHERVRELQGPQDPAPSRKAVAASFSSSPSSSSSSKRRRNRCSMDVADNETADSIMALYSSGALAPCTPPSTPPRHLGSANAPPPPPVATVPTPAAAASVPSHDMAPPASAPRRLMPPCPHVVDYDPAAVHAAGPPPAAFGPAFAACEAALRRPQGTSTTPRSIASVAPTILLSSAQRPDTPYRVNQWAAIPLTRPLMPPGGPLPASSGTNHSSSSRLAPPLQPPKPKSSKPKKPRLHKGSQTTIDPVLSMPGPARRAKHAHQPALPPLLPDPLPSAGAQAVPRGPPAATSSSIPRGAVMRRGPSQVALAAPPPPSTHYQFVPPFPYSSAAAASALALGSAYQPPMVKGWASRSLSLLAVMTQPQQPGSTQANTTAAPPTPTRPHPPTPRHPLPPPPPPRKTQHTIPTATRRPKRPPRPGPPPLPAPPIASAPPGPVMSMASSPVQSGSCHGRTGTARGLMTRMS